MPARRWATASVLVAVVVVQLASLVGAFWSAGSNRLHGADAVLSAPAGVAAPLADSANDLPGGPFRVRVAESSAEARAEVDRGAAVVALLVDLRGTEDVLVVDGSVSGRLYGALVDQVRVVESSRGRTVVVERTEAAATAGRVRAATLLATAGGFLLWFLVGRRGSRLLVAGSGLAVAVTADVVLLGSAALSRPDTAAALAGVVGIALLVARAVDRLLGSAGLALGAASYVVLAVPVLDGLDPLLLGPPWSGLVATTPTWASYELVGAVADHAASTALRPAAVLACWAAAAVIGGLRSRVGPDRAPQASGLRTFGLLAVALAVTLGVVRALPEPEAAPVTAPALAAETTCVATGPIDDLDDLNRISSQVRGDPSFQGGDVGAGVPLQDGRRLLVFGDTLRGADVPGQRFVRNSMLVFGPDCAQAVVPASGGALIPDRPAGTGPAIGHWPMSIGRVERPGYDLVAVAAQRVQTTGDGPFDFRNLGPSVAVFVVPSGRTPQLLAVRDVGADRDDHTRPTWGAAAAVDDGWLYLYGTARPQDDAGVFGFSLSVARVRPDDLLDVDRWTYWNGREWQPDPAGAVVLIPAVGGVSQTLSVFREGETWYALSKRDEFLGSDLVVWRAPSPWGPFDGGTVVGRLPSDAETGQLRYMPLAHPELLPEPGTVVVSYSRNRTDLGAVIADPFQYRPRFLRVALPGAETSGRS